MEKYISNKFLMAQLPKLKELREQLFDNCEDREMIDAIHNIIEATERLTEDVQIENLRVPYIVPNRCSICGKPIKTVMDGHSDKCFSCGFWSAVIAEHSPNRFISDSTVYVIQDEDLNITFRGFDGAKVTVTFEDGRVVKTSNLWCNGDAPERFKRYFNKASLVWKW